MGLWSTQGPSPTELARLYAVEHHAKTILRVWDEFSTMKEPWDVNMKVAIDFLRAALGR